MNINVIGRKNIFLAIALILVVLSLASIAVFRFRLGVDFAGGTLWDLKVANGSPATVKSVLEQAGAKSPIVAYDAATGDYSVTLPQTNENERAVYLSALESKFSGVQSLDVWSLSPSVSASLARRAVEAIILVLAGISFFVAYAFRMVSRPVSSWKYGFITLLTLVHDVVIPAGVYAALGYFFGLTIDSNFVIALLVIMGFSVHDTIVVFDRTRENLSKQTSGKINLPEIVNKSVNETMHRSINTSFSLVLVLLALYFLGPANLKFFALTLLIGVIAGTYSSIFIASPLLVLSNREKKKK
jgi:preprotein translocase subunit SecF